MGLVAIAALRNIAANAIDAEEGSTAVTMTGIGTIDRERATASMTVKSRLSIGVIGGLTLSVAGRPLVLGNRRARAMLAYLAMERTATIGRERLASLFWSESSDRHARNSLRNTIHEMRDALEGRGCTLLEGGRDDLRLAADGFDVDFEQALASIAGGEVPPILLGSAQGIDQMLAGYDNLSVDFGEWVATVRHTSRTRLLRALETSYQDTRLPTGSRRHLADLALRLDPLHEDACRELMRLAARAGEVGIALRAYSSLYDAMGLDLDMEPSQATQDLVAEIKLGRMTPAPEPTIHAVAAKPTASPPAAQGGVPVVAVLPLRAVGSDDMTAWIADAVMEDLVRMLAGQREPAVISANSTRLLLADGSDLATLGARLGAGYLVSGSVRLAGQKGRVSVELAQSSTGLVLWSEAYDVASSDIFDTLQRIAACIANALGPRVNAAELRRSLGQPPEDLEAYHLLLRARELIFRMERTSLEEAGILIHQAIDKEPGYPGGHAARAYWYSLRIFQGWSNDAMHDTQSLMDAARTAIALDPYHARALALLGHNLTLALHRYDEAEELVDRAVELAPNDADVLCSATPTCAYVGRTDEAISRATRALQLSPTDPFRFRFEHFRSLAHYVAEDYVQAAAWGLRSWSGNPNFTSNQRITIAALSALGRHEEARPLVDRHRSLQPNYRVSNLLTASTFRQREQRERFALLLGDAGLP